MDRSNSRTLLVKAAGFLGVAGLSVLISLPGLSQQAPGNTNPDVPSTVKPTNPGGQDAGTTNGGEDLNRVPSTDSTPQQRDSNSQNNGTPANSNPGSSSDPINRVEGRDQGTQRGTVSSPDGTNTQQTPSQPDSTSGGEPSQRLEQNGGSTTQQNRTTPQGSDRSVPQQRSQSESDSTSPTSDTGATQAPATGGSVRALW